MMDPPLTTPQARLEALIEDMLLELVALHALVQQIRDHLAMLTTTDHYGVGRGGRRGSRAPY